MTLREYLLNFDTEYKNSSYKLNEYTLTFSHYNNPFHQLTTFDLFYKAIEYKQYVTILVSNGSTGYVFNIDKPMMKTKVEDLPSNDLFDIIKSDTRNKKINEFLTYDIKRRIG